MIHTWLVSREDSKIQQLSLMRNNIHYVLVATKSSYCFGPEDTNITHNVKKLLLTYISKYFHWLHLSFIPHSKSYLDIVYEQKAYWNE